MLKASFTHTLTEPLSFGFDQAFRLKLLDSFYLIFQSQIIWDFHCWNSEYLTSNEWFAYIDSSLFSDKMVFKEDHKPIQHGQEHNQKDASQFTFKNGKEVDDRNILK